MMQVPRKTPTSTTSSTPVQALATGPRCPLPPLPSVLLRATDGRGEGICQGSSLLCELPGAGERNTKAQRPLIPWQSERGAGPEKRWPCLLWQAHVPVPLGRPASFSHLGPQGGKQDLCQPLSWEEFAPRKEDKGGHSECRCALGADLGLDGVCSTQIHNK